MSAKFSNDDHTSDVSYNYKMKFLIIIGLCLTITHQTKTYANELKIEPVYGVERTQRLYPEPARYRTTTFLGLRALYGKPIFSLEAEVNQSTSKEEFPDDNLEVEYIDRKALLGFRTYPLTSKIFGVFLRFGARAQQNERNIKENGESRSEKDPLTFDPYAGTGLTMVLGSNFSLNAGATLIYNRNAVDENEKYDTRYSLSFTIKAGNR